VAYEIVLLDNGPVSRAAEEFTENQENFPDTRVLRIVETFNHARLNNLGANLSDREFLLFLNNDMIVGKSSWLRLMAGECRADEKVGAVGCKLLYLNKTVQHAGVVLGAGGVADHAFRGIGGDAPGYVMRAQVARRVSAVAAACMLVRRQAFAEVDLCVKRGMAGWKTLYAAEAVAEHREGCSRGHDFAEPKRDRFMRESTVMRRRHALPLADGLFYNLRFSARAAPIGSCA